MLLIPKNTAQQAQQKTMQLKTLALLIIALFSLQYLIACSSEPESRKDVHTDLKSVMLKRKAAIEAKDIEAYKKLFLKEYLDGGVTYQLLIEDMKNQFAAHEKITFDYKKNPMNFKFNTARMVSMVSYQTEKMEKPVFHHEKTIFRRIDGAWYISGGVAVSLF